MSAVDWNAYFPNRSLRVIFSNLEWGEARAPYEDEVAAIALPGSMFLDIEWDSEARNYVLRVHQGSVRNPPIARANYPAIVQLIAGTGEWIDRCASAFTSVSNATSLFLQSELPANTAQVIQDFAIRLPTGVTFQVCGAMG